MRRISSLLLALFALLALPTLGHAQDDAGISVGDTTLGTAVANLGWDEVRFPKPLFHGDTIRIESEVLEIRESKSRPDNGIVIFAHRAYNQREELVGSCKRSALMLRKQK